MAAIGPRVLRAAGPILLLSAFPMFADRAADVRAQVSRIATALTDGNAADAIGAFDKSFSKYDKLRSYFEGLTNSFQLANEVDVTNEQDTDDETKLSLTWALTVTDLSTNYSDRRSAEINVRLVRQGKQWKIVDFSPIELFNPQWR